jgi:glycine betaine/proline transport system ATP-binding protein
MRQHALVAAVRDVTLDVREGEIFVIMGLSGSGKSTLVRCMSRLIEPTAGEILFNGENLLSASPQRMIEIRRHQMGMVFQHFALLPHLTVLDNVAFPLEVQGMGRRERETRARADDRPGGAGRARGLFPAQLSGGQQQRVGIARSLAVEPEDLVSRRAILGARSADPARDAGRVHAAADGAATRPSSSSPMISTRPSAWLTGSPS